VKPIALAAMLAGALVAVLGCNPRVGLIVMDTYPQGATVYLNEAKVGETPVTFEFNMEKPVALRLVKEGYHPRTEVINVAWVKNEYRHGHYAKGDFVLQGRVQPGYEVRTLRDLSRLEAQAVSPPAPQVTAPQAMPPHTPPPQVAPTLTAARCTDPAPAPAFQVGEKWTWRYENGKEDSNEVLQVDAETTQVKWSNGDVAFFDKDRILRKVQRKNGEVLTTQGSGMYTTIGQKTMVFPLRVGKKWEYSYMAAPANNTWGLQSYLQSHEVVACEDVTTAVGRFAAFKIAVHQRAATLGTGGQLYIWYAPDVKNLVRRKIGPERYWGQTNNFELVKYERG